MERFLDLIDHPQRHYPAVHVAGTSGKGSTATMIAALLRASGLRTGLHVTPYLQVATEKLAIDGHYVSADEFAALIDWLRPLAERFRGPDVPMHGIGSVAITLECFRRQRVDIAVVEAGVGGRKDITNVVNTKVAVIGPIGYDHIKTLGPSLEEIAWHKAGVIRPGCAAAVVLDGAGRAAAEEQAKQVGVPLTVLRADRYTYRLDHTGHARLDYFGDRLTIRDVRLAMPGAFQAQNAALALAALELLNEQLPAHDDLAAALAAARLPGRGEWLQLADGPKLLFDGAHNPDKLSALGQMLATDKRRIHLVYGTLRSHPPGAATLALASRAASLTVTEPDVYAKAPCPATELALQFPGAIAVERPEDAIARALGQAANDDIVLVTGSLYLVGQVRNAYYPAEQVLSQGTSWPS
ncbi:MAG: bifunctional folylpolyglutamate synthase/dihydrofolate synthase [Deltaproteobacteria bacterium]|nr:bifunctional folylpolyglutamate synthase/dihydrofolate synthase [Deltaproteobacteria bacterium]